MNIIINEHQLSILERLINESEPILNNGDTVEYGQPGKIGTSAVVTTTDGKPKMGNDVAADEISAMSANQDWRGNIKQRFV